MPSTRQHTGYHAVPQLPSVADSQPPLSTGYATGVRRGDYAAAPADVYSQPVSAPAGDSYRTDLPCTGWQRCGQLRGHRAGLAVSCHPAASDTCLTLQRRPTRRRTQVRRAITTICLRPAATTSRRRATRSAPTPLPTTVRPPVPPIRGRGTGRSRLCALCGRTGRAATTRLRISRFSSQPIRPTLGCPAQSAGRCL